MTSVLRRNTQSKGGGNVSTEAEIEVTVLQANEHLQPPEAERDKELIAPYSLQPC